MERQQEHLHQRRGRHRAAWAVAALLCLGGCGADAGGFLGTRTLNACDQDYPVCNTAAGCVLDESQYAEGTFPGVQQVIFRTQAPAQVRVRLLFTQELSPGKDTQIEFNEVGCSMQRTYSSMGQDIFQLAGDAQQLSASEPLSTPGDHLIRIQSDATAHYQLRVEVVPTS